MQLDFIRGSTIYENSPPTQVSAYVRRHIGTHEMTTNCKTGNAMLRHTMLGNFGLSVISYGSHTEVVSPTGIAHYHFQMVLSGNSTVHVDGSTVVLQPGWAMFINPSKPSSVSYSPDCTKLIVTIPKSLFNACLLERSLPIPKEGVHFENDAFQFSDRSSVFRSVELLYLAAEERASRAGMAQASLEMFFGSKMLECFPNNIHVPISIDRDEHLFAIADMYIEAHIKDDISAADLVRRCNVSSRTLYERFTSHKGMTPTAYIKEKKLRKIYAHLSGRGYMTRSVTEIALEYGLLHLGRFSADYKTIFGELPSETFRRTRNGKH
jgi:AraC-like DNA-binding protein/mannose-6-phosphate isomerase-like protein (cupin superfamily)